MQNQMSSYWMFRSLLNGLRHFPIKHFFYSAINPILGTHLYQKSLGCFNDINQFQPPKVEKWPGDSGRGTTIIDGDFELAGKTLLDTNTPWCAEETSTRWRSRAAYFDWLCDLQALGGNLARDRARQLIISWINTDGNWSRTTWQPEGLGNRISNWISHADFILSDSENVFQEKFISSLYRQTQYLSRIYVSAPRSSEKITILKGLIFADLTFSNGHRKKLLADRLDKELLLQILKDGGTQNRNPSKHLAILRDLIDIRTAYISSNNEPSKILNETIKTMAPILRFFRHGDGMLALFNGSVEEESWLVDIILERSEERKKPPDSMPVTGFERLARNRTLVILDVGMSPPRGFDCDAHAGALSFELSIGKERLIVNCGAHIGDNQDWRIAQRSTAAHSTVSVENINSAEVLSKGGLGYCPKIFPVTRNERDGEVWLETEHDGYYWIFGLVHHRKLHLNSNGTNLRGEDSLLGQSAHKFTVRFHLHPSVQSSLLQNGTSVLLRLPSGEGWRFKAANGVIGLQESVYLGAGDRIKRSKQIVISSATGKNVKSVKWMFARM
ncbi:MAG: hypothetical protein CMM44_01995 [Rhodospirillaceae bacterium]|nr:hypothetical protein [Rhodospirillaceae bacterium]|tara:strand:+ start:7565 stop:9235 length:1671 start_codon:yes stop_codon:yes gene_type:complete